MIDQAHAKYNAELYQLTGGEVARASELPALQNWLHQRGIHMNSMDADAIETMTPRRKVCLRNAAARWRYGKRSAVRR